MFSAIEFSISIDDELSALLTDYAAFTGDVTAVGATDPLAVVDPMATADAMMFTGVTAPAVVDAPVDPAPTPATNISTDIAADTPTDATIDLSALPGLDGLVQLDDGGFDLDLTILDVGRGFGQFGFNDLP